MSRRRPLQEMIDARHPGAPWGTCRWCGEPILKPDGNQNCRRRWHPDCHKEMMSNDHQVLRSRVRVRDMGICAVCGFDCGLAQRQLNREGWEYGYKPHTPFGRMLRKIGFDVAKSLWEMDHIVPLTDGGKHTLEWVWTLCQLCHRKKTSMEATLRAQDYEPHRDHLEGAKNYWRLMCRS